MIKNSYKLKMTLTGILKKLFFIPILLIFLFLGLALLIQSSLLVVDVGKAGYALLSFDTELCDSEYVMEELLGILDDEKIEATFFVTGQFAEMHKDLVLRISKKHEIACHTYSHKKLTKISQEEKEQEIKKCQDILTQIGIDSIGFRAPYNQIDEGAMEILDEIGIEYDASMFELYRFLYPFIDDYALEEISISTVAFLPCSDAVLIYLPFPRLFFHACSKKKGEYASFNLHPHRIIKYKKEFKAFLSSLKKDGHAFVTHKRFLNSKRDAYAKRKR